MTSFLYFLPGHAAEMISHEQIIKAGIGYVFDKPGDVTVNLLRAAGPGGKSGAIITNPLRIEPGRNQFKPDLQTWLPNGDGYYVGVWNDAVPAPGELERRKMLRGRKLELADEREWLIPIGCSWAESDNQQQWFDIYCELPCSIGFGQGQVFLRKPLARYASLWALCEIAARKESGQHVTDAEAALVTGNGALFSAVKILSANYAVGPTEIDLLGLFSQDTAGEILKIFCDWETWDDIAEKKTAELASPPSSAGQEATPQTTAQL